MNGLKARASAWIAMAALTAAPMQGAAQRAPAIASCASGPAPALDRAMLVDGASVRFTARVTRAPAACAYRTTTRGCYATCTSHALARGARGVVVHVRGGSTDCARTDRPNRRDCPFADNQSLTFEGTLRKLGDDWWLDASSACRG